MDKTDKIAIAAGNWKMNMLPSEVSTFFNEYMSKANTLEKTIFCVPYIDIPAAISAVKNTPIEIYAQNFYYEPKGAYTGEVSLDMLKDADVTGVVIGHSERRDIFGETNETINKKVLAAKAAGMKIILCVGESEHTREINAHHAWIEYQVLSALEGITDTKDIIIAYEPIWAIGTGKTASAEDAQDMCKFIDYVLHKYYNSFEAVPILYGGSVNEKNAAELFAQSSIDGGLVGGASLVAEKFAQIRNA
ncbi:MAG: triose-phosphate isomerase [Clostridia bacterium]|nr:triose-phosphate isomerase [Clostridia bacterium]